MINAVSKTSFGSNLVQIAWIVKDIQNKISFFKENFGVNNFGNIETIRVNEFEGTYYGNSSNAEFLVCVAYSGGTFVEIIQPVSGHSIFQDYLDKNPSGGIQHIAYNVPVINLE